MSTTISELSIAQVSQLRDVFVAATNGRLPVIKTRTRRRLVAFGGDASSSNNAVPVREESPSSPQKAQVVGSNKLKTGPSAVGQKKPTSSSGSPRTLSPPPLMQQENSTPAVFSVNTAPVLPRPEGSLPLADFALVWTAVVGVGATSDEMLALLFDLLDDDGDGYITWENIHAAVEATRQDEALERLRVSHQQDEVNVREEEQNAQVMRRRRMLERFSHRKGAAGSASSSGAGTDGSNGAAGASHDDAMQTARNNIGSAVETNYFFPISDEVGATTLPKEAHHKEAIARVFMCGGLFAHASSSASPTSGTSEQDPSSAANSQGGRVLPPLGASKGTTSGLGAQTLPPASTSTTGARSSRYFSGSVASDTLITFSFDGSVKLWDSRKGTLEHTLHYSAHGGIDAAYEATSGLLAVVGADYAITVYHVPTRRMLRNFVTGRESGVVFRQEYRAPISASAGVILSNGKPPPGPLVEGSVLQRYWELRHRGMLQRVWAHQKAVLSFPATPLSAIGTVTAVAVYQDVVPRYAFVLAGDDRGALFTFRVKVAGQFEDGPRRGGTGGDSSDSSSDDDRRGGRRPRSGEGTDAGIDPICVFYPHCAPITQITVVHRDDISASMNVGDPTAGSSTAALGFQTSAAKNPLLSPRSSTQGSPRKQQHQQESTNTASAAERAVLARLRIITSSVDSDIHVLTGDRGVVLKTFRGTTSWTMRSHTRGVKGFAWNDRRLIRAATQPSASGRRRGAADDVDDARSSDGEIDIDRPTLVLPQFQPMLASWGLERHLVLWDPLAGKPTDAISTPCRIASAVFVVPPVREQASALAGGAPSAVGGGAGGASSGSGAYNPQQLYVLIFTEDRSLRLWDTRTLACVQHTRDMSLFGATGAVFYDPQRDAAYSCTARLNYWPSMEERTGCVGVSQTKHMHKHRVLGQHHWERGRILVTADQASLHMWNRDTGALLSAWPMKALVSFVGDQEGACVLVDALEPSAQHMAASGYRPPEPLQTSGASTCLQVIDSNRAQLSDVLLGTARELSDCDVLFVPYRGRWIATTSHHLYVYNSEARDLAMGKDDEFDPFVDSDDERGGHKLTVGRAGAVRTKQRSANTSSADAKDSNISTGAEVFPTAADITGLSVTSLLTPFKIRRPVTKRKLSNVPNVTALTMADDFIVMGHLSGDLSCVLFANVGKHGTLPMVPRLKAAAVLAASQETCTSSFTDPIPTCADSVRTMGCRWMSAVFGPLHLDPRPLVKRAMLRQQLLQKRQMSERRQERRRQRALALASGVAPSAVRTSADDNDASTAPVDDSSDDGPDEDVQRAAESQAHAVAGSGGSTNEQQANGGDVKLHPQSCRIESLVALSGTMVVSVDSDSVMSLWNLTPHAREIIRWLPVFGPFSTVTAVACVRSPTAGKPALLYYADDEAYLGAFAFDLEAIHAALDVQAAVEEAQLRRHMRRLSRRGSSFSNTARSLSGTGTALFSRAQSRRRSFGAAFSRRASLKSTGGFMGIGKMAATPRTTGGGASRVGSAQSARGGGGQARHRPQPPISGPLAYFCNATPTTGKTTTASGPATASSTSTGFEMSAFEASVAQCISRTLVRRLPDVPPDDVETRYNASAIMTGAAKKAGLRGGRYITTMILIPGRSLWSCGCNTGEILILTMGGTVAASLGRRPLPPGPELDRLLASPVAHRSAEASLSYGHQVLLDMLRKEVLLRITDDYGKATMAEIVASLERAQRSGKESLKQRHHQDGEESSGSPLYFGATSTAAFPENSVLLDSSSASMSIISKCEGGANLNADDSPEMLRLMQTSLVRLQCLFGNPNDVFVGTSDCVFSSSNMNQSNINNGTSPTHLKASQRQSTTTAVGALGNGNAGSPTTTNPAVPPSPPPPLCIAPTVVANTLNSMSVSSASAGVHTHDRNLTIHECRLMERTDDGFYLSLMEDESTAVLQHVLEERIREVQEGSGNAGDADKFREDRGGSGLDLSMSASGAPSHVRRTRTAAAGRRSPREGAANSPLVSHKRVIQSFTVIHLQSVPLTASLVNLRDGTRLSGPGTDENFGARCLQAVLGTAREQQAIAFVRAVAHADSLFASVAAIGHVEGSTGNTDATLADERQVPQIPLQRSLMAHRLFAEFLLRVPSSWVVAGVHPRHATAFWHAALHATGSMSERLVGTVFRGSRSASVSFAFSSGANNTNIINNRRISGSAVTDRDDVLSDTDTSQARPAPFLEIQSSGDSSSGFGSDSDNIGDRFIQGHAAGGATQVFDNLDRYLPLADTVMLELSQSETVARREQCVKEALWWRALANLCREAERALARRIMERYVFSPYRFARRVFPGLNAAFAAPAPSTPPPAVMSSAAIMLTSLGSRPSMLSTPSLTSRTGTMPRSQGTSNQAGAAKQPPVLIDPLLGTATVLAPTTLRVAAVNSGLSAPFPAGHDHKKKRARSTGNIIRLRTTTTNTGNPSQRQRCRSLPASAHALRSAPGPVWMTVGDPFVSGEGLHWTARWVHAVQNVDFAYDMSQSLDAPSDAILSPSPIGSSSTRPTAPKSGPDQRLASTTATEDHRHVAASILGTYLNAPANGADTLLHAHAPPAVRLALAHLETIESDFDRRSKDVIQAIRSMQRTARSAVKEGPAGVPPTVVLASGALKTPAAATGRVGSASTSREAVSADPASAQRLNLHAVAQFCLPSAVVNVADASFVPDNEVAKTARTRLRVPGSAIPIEAPSSRKRPFLLRPCINTLGSELQFGAPTEAVQTPFSCLSSFGDVSHATYQWEVADEGMLVTRVTNPLVRWAAVRLYGQFSPADADDDGDMRPSSASRNTAPSSEVYQNVYTIIKTQLQNEIKSLRLVHATQSRVGGIWPRVFTPLTCSIDVDGDLYICTSEVPCGPTDTIWSSQQGLDPLTRSALSYLAFDLRTLHPSIRLRPLPGVSFAMTAADYDHRVYPKELLETAPLLHGLRRSGNGQLFLCGVFGKLPLYPGDGLSGTPQAALPMLRPGIARGLPHQDTAPGGGGGVPTPSVGNRAQQPPVESPTLRTSKSTGTFTASQRASTATDAQQRPASSQRGTNPLARESAEQPTADCAVLLHPLALQSVLPPLVRKAADKTAAKCIRRIEATLLPAVAAVLRRRGAVLFDDVFSKTVTVGTAAAGTGSIAVTGGMGDPLIPAIKTARSASNTPDPSADIANKVMAAEMARHNEITPNVVALLHEHSANARHMGTLLDTLHRDERLLCEQRSVLCKRGFTSLDLLTGNAPDGDHHHGVAAAVGACAAAASTEGVPLRYFRTTAWRLVMNEILARVLAGLIRDHCYAIRSRLPNTSATSSSTASTAQAIDALATCCRAYAPAASHPYAKAVSMRVPASVSGPLAGPDVSLAAVAEYWVTLVCLPWEISREREGLTSRRMSTSSSTIASGGGGGGGAPFLVDGGQSQSFGGASVRVSDILSNEELDHLARDEHRWWRDFMYGEMERRFPTVRSTGSAGNPNTATTSGSSGSAADTSVRRSPPRRGNRRASGTSQSHVGGAPSAAALLPPSPPSAYDQLLPLPSEYCRGNAELVTRLMGLLGLSGLPLDPTSAPSPGCGEATPAPANAVPNNTNGRQQQPVTPACRQTLPVGRLSISRGPVTHVPVSIGGLRSIVEARTAPATTLFAREAVLRVRHSSGRMTSGLERHCREEFWAYRQREARSAAMDIARQTMQFLMQSWSKTTAASSAEEAGVSSVESSNTGSPPSNSWRDLQLCRVPSLQWWFGRLLDAADGVCRQYTVPSRPAASIRREPSVTPSTGGGSGRPTSRPPSALDIGIPASMATSVLVDRPAALLSPRTAAGGGALSPLRAAVHGIMATERLSPRSLASAAVGNVYVDATEALIGSSAAVIVPLRCAVMLCLKQYLSSSRAKVNCQPPPSSSSASTNTQGALAKKQPSRSGRLSLSRSGWGESASGSALPTVSSVAAIDFYPSFKLRSEALGALNVEESANPPSVRIHHTTAAARTLEHMVAAMDFPGLPPGAVAASVQTLQAPLSQQSSAPSRCGFANPFALLLVALGVQLLQRHDGEGRTVAAEKASRAIVDRLLSAMNPMLDPLIAASQSKGGGGGAFPMSGLALYSVPANTPDTMRELLQQARVFPPTALRDGFSGPMTQITMSASTALIPPALLIAAQVRSAARLFQAPVALWGFDEAFAALGGLRQSPRRYEGTSAASGAGTSGVARAGGGIPTAVGSVLSQLTLRDLFEEACAATEALRRNHWYTIHHMQPLDGFGGRSLLLALEVARSYAKDDDDARAAQAILETVRDALGRSIHAGAVTPHEAHEIAERAAFLAIDLAQIRSGEGTAEFTSKHNDTTSAGSAVTEHLSNTHGTETNELVAVSSPAIDLVDSFLQLLSEARDPSTGMPFGFGPALLDTESDDEGPPRGGDDDATMGVLPSHTDALTMAGKIIPNISHTSQMAARLLIRKAALTADTATKGVAIFDMVMGVGSAHAPAVGAQSHSVLSLRDPVAVRNGAAASAAMLKDAMTNVDAALSLLEPMYVAATSAFGAAKQVLQADTPLPTLDTDVPSRLAMHLALTAPAPLASIVPRGGQGLASSLSFLHVAHASDAWQHAQLFDLYRLALTTKGRIAALAASVTAHQATMAVQGLAEAVSRYTFFVVSGRLAAQHTSITTRREQLRRDLDSLSSAAKRTRNTVLGAPTATDGTGAASQLCSPQLGCAQKLLEVTERVFGAASGQACDAMVGMATAFTAHATAILFFDDCATVVKVVEAQVALLRAEGGLSGGRIEATGSPLRSLQPSNPNSSHVEHGRRAIDVLGRHIVKEYQKAVHCLTVACDLAAASFGRDCAATPAIGLRLAAAESLAGDVLEAFTTATSALSTLRHIAASESDRRLGAAERLRVCAAADGPRSLEDLGGEAVVALLQAPVSGLLLSQTAFVLTFQSLLLLHTTVDMQNAADSNAPRPNGAGKKGASAHNSTADAAIAPSDIPALIADHPDVLRTVRLGDGGYYQLVDARALTNFALIVLTDRPAPEGRGKPPQTHAQSGTQHSSGQTLSPRPVLSPGTTPRKKQSPTTTTTTPHSAGDVAAYALMPRGCGMIRQFLQGLLEQLEIHMIISRQEVNNAALRGMRQQLLLRWGKIDVDLKPAQTTLTTYERDVMFRPVYLLH